MPSRIDFLCWASAVFFALALGFPNNFVDLPFLVLLWPLGCAALGLRAQSAFEAARAGWLASFAGGAVVLYWLYMPVHEVGNLPFFAALGCAFGITLVMTSMCGLFSLCAWLARGFAPWRAAALLGLAWYLLEWGYAVVFGFPWLSPAGALAGAPILLRICDIFGAYGAAGFWVFALVLGLFSFPPFGERMSRPLLAISLALCFAIPVYGWLRDGTGREGQAVDALFVEGNVDQNQKWEPVFQRATLDLYMRLTEEGLAAMREAGINEPLVIWPETALPFFYQSRPELAAVARDFVKETGCPLLFGAPGLETLPGGTEPVVFNRAFLLKPDGALAGYYDKEHLVPFGEYLPSWLDLDFLKALTQGVGIYHEGSRTAPLRYGPLALGMLICYEGIFPWLAQARVAGGANILVDISNDGWFGTSPAARQHLYLTVPRCMEQGRWMLRATNTGISAVVNPAGRITMRGPQFRAGALPAKGFLEQGKSAYHLFSPWLPGAGFALFGLLWLLPGKKGRNGDHPA